MELPKDFEPKCRRWFVRQDDYGRQVWIVPALESKDGSKFVLCEFSPSLYHTGFERTTVPQMMHRSQVLVGQEPLSCMFTPEEAQDLMDAMWRAGMRPTRR